MFRNLKKKPTVKQGGADTQAVWLTEDEAMSHGLLKPCGCGAVKARGQWRV